MSGRKGVVEVQCECGRVVRVIVEVLTNQASQTSLLTSQSNDLTDSLLVNTQRLKDTTTSLVSYLEGSSTTKRLINRKSCAYDDPNFSTIFWPVYPRKVAKAEALKAWKQQKIETQDQMDRVMAGLKKHIELVWPGKDKDFIPHPASWLRGKRWEDDLTPATPQSAPGGSVEALQGRLDAARKRREQIEAEIQSVKGGRT